MSACTAKVTAYCYVSGGWVCLGSRTINSRSNEQFSHCGAPCWVALRRGKLFAAASQEFLDERSERVEVPSRGDGAEVKSGGITFRVKQGGVPRSDPPPRTFRRSRSRI